MCTLLHLGGIRLGKAVELVFNASEDRDKNHKVGVCALFCSHPDRCLTS